MSVFQRSWVITVLLGAGAFLHAAAALGADDRYSLFPPAWINSANETTPLDYSSRPDLPKPELVAVFDNDALDESNDYISAAEFAFGETAVFGLFGAGKILKYDFIEKKLLWELSIGNDTRQFALTQDGEKVIVTDHDGVRVLKSRDGSLLHQLSGICAYSCMAVAISKDGRFVIAGDTKGVVHIVEIARPANHWRRLFHNWPVRKLLFIEDGERRFLVTSDATEAVLFDVNADEERRRISSRNEHDGFRDFWINSLTAVPGTNFFVVGGYKDVYILDAGPGEIVGWYKDANQLVVSAYASRDLKHVKAISRDHVIYSWDSDSGAVTSQYYMETPLLSVFTHSSISPDGNYTTLSATDMIFGFPPKARNRIRIFRTPQ